MAKKGIFDELQKEILKTLPKPLEMQKQEALAEVENRFSSVPQVSFEGQIEELKKREAGYTAPEQEAMWSQMASRANAQQQAAQRALAARQAQMGVQGGAGSAQLARQQQMFAAQKAMAGQELSVRNIDEMTKRLRERQQLEREQQLAAAAREAARIQLQEAALGRISAEAIAREQAKAQAEAAKKIICTELYNQGLMPEDTYIADQQFGQLVRLHMPEHMIGYHILAKPVVKLMQKSKVITSIVKVIAMPWANEMKFQVGASDKGSFVGKYIMKAGMLLCGVVGHIATRYQHKKVV